MSTDQELTIPSHSDPLEGEIALLRRWIEGWVDQEGKRHPGLNELVGELYGELKARRERREAFVRTMTAGSILAIFGFVLNWLKDHWK